MSKLLKTAIAAVMITGLTGCVSTNDIKVETVKSEKANLKGYKTYEIIKESGAVDTTKKDPALKGVDVDAGIKKMIKETLAKKGKTEVKADPDFYVAYLFGTDMDALEIKLDKEGATTIKNVPAAAMVLMLVDADTGSILWMSTAEADYKNLPIEAKRERMKYAIEKMLKGL
ncbi:DUF4136 domain-containing protein [Sulfurovum sp. NBC37-1]|uniref:DUF4136 domain-containing protein n=1 Tax=Sulfurovum sp. (strain NBC37-1) TaxID=387093 RepID=UPI0001587ABB|nr:DUF4136 domain-containing protein [Sulfurovum sp. NBC37-1]BAF73329.1 hypothetical protein SUN_2393 [Sulfurovum sp. NBC37-1]